MSSIQDLQNIEENFDTVKRSTVEVLNRLTKIITTFLNNYSTSNTASTFNSRKLHEKQPQQMKLPLKYEKITKQKKYPSTTVSKLMPKTTKLVSKIAHKTTKNRDVIRDMSNTLQKSSKQSNKKQTKVSSRKKISKRS